MSKRSPTPAELVEEAGTWREVGGKAVRPKFAKDQAELLGKLKGLLEMEQASLQKKLMEARETLARVQHGGGS